MNGLCFDNPILPLCQATLSSVDQITCGSVQSMTTAGGLPYDHDGPLEKLGLGLLRRTYPISSYNAHGSHQM